MRAKYAPAGVAYPLRCAIRCCTSDVLGEMQIGCNEDWMEVRREARADARGTRCLNMTGVPEEIETKRKMWFGEDNGGSES